MEEHGRCVHVAGEWLGHGNTAWEVVEFRGGNSRGFKKLHSIVAVATNKEDWDDNDDHQ